MVTKVQNVMTPQNTSPRPSNHGRCHQEVKKPCILWISEESDEQQGMRNAEGSKWAEAQKITLSLLRASTAVLRTQRSSVPQASVSEVSFLLYLATRVPVVLRPSFLSTEGIAAPQLVLNFHLNLWHSHRGESTGWKVRLMLSHFYLIDHQWAM